jgi:hypothetical protein
MYPAPFIAWAKRELHYKKNSKENVLQRPLCLIAHGAAHD